MYFYKSKYNQTCLTFIGQVNQEPFIVTKHDKLPKLTLIETDNPIEHKLSETVVSNRHNHHTPRLLILLSRLILVRVPILAHHTRYKFLSAALVDKLELPGRESHVVVSLGGRSETVQVTDQRQDAVAALGQILKHPDLHEDKEHGGQKRHNCSSGPDDSPPISTQHTAHFFPVI
jgi:hypothetical protein